MIRFILTLLFSFFIVQNAKALEKRSLTNSQIGKIFQFYVTETNFGQSGQYFRDVDESIKDDTGKTRTYAVFYFMYGDDKIGKTVSSAHLINRYTGHIFYRQSNCIRYHSESLEKYRQKVRNETPYSLNIYQAEYDHFLKISEPLSVSCFENNRPQNLISLTEAENIFHTFLKNEKIASNQGYYAEKYGSPLQEADSNSDYDYYKFSLISTSHRQNRPAPRSFFMNAWTGELYEQRLDNPCTIWSSPALHAARIALYARKGLTDSDLAPHHAHFRTITAPRSANCLGDRLDGLTTTAEEFGIISPQEPDKP